MAGPRAGERFAVTTPTHASVAMELDGGLTVSYVASFEANSRYICDFEIHGTDRSLLLPDPNGFGGALRMRQSRSDWEEIPYTGGRCPTRRAASACTTWWRRSAKDATIAPPAGSAST